MWLGLGAVSFDLLLAVLITSVLRRRLGYRSWRAVHWLAYASWPVAVIHGIGTGTDDRRLVDARADRCLRRAPWCWPSASGSGRLGRRTRAWDAAAAMSLPRMLAGLDADRGVLGVREHERVYGPMPRLGGSELIDAVQRSGLRGRGGADFPTARKLRAVAARRRVSAVVVNGSETEPASGKDRLLLSQLPHLVLDGAVLAARAVGAREVIVKLGGSAVVGARRGRDARAARRPGPDPAVGRRGGYVAGEESAVVQSLNGGAALPTFTPAAPYRARVSGPPDARSRTPRRSPRSR